MSNFHASTSRIRFTTTVAALALALSACGDSETDASATTETTTATTVESTTSTTEAPATTTTSTTAAPIEPVAEADLPGVDFDFGPGEGSIVHVVGVDVDDVLNVRRLPDASSEILSELDPIAEVTLTGRKRDLTTSIWYEVKADAGVGWANAVYLAPVGGTRDATVEFTELLGGTLPTGSSTLEVIEQLENLLLAAGQEGPTQTVTVVDGPRVGDLDEVVIDVLGYPDDSIRGDRLMVFVRNEGGLASIVSIESTSLCQRGSDGAYCL